MGAITERNARLARLTLWSAFAALAALAAGLSVPPEVDLLPAHTAMPAVHLLLEGFGTVIAVLIVIVSWHTAEGERKNRAVTALIAGFTVVACCDLVHALTYDSMPPFLGPGSTARSIFFWLAGRSVELATLALVALAWPPLRSRRVALAAGLAASVALLWVGSWHLDLLPATFVEGSGVTPFKRAFEIALSAGFAAVALLFWRRARREGDARLYLLALASLVTGMGELMFTHYLRPSEFQNVFGHLFKVAAYVLLYRATFVAAMREPFGAAEESARRLRDSEEKLRGLFELSPVGIALTDMQGHYLEFNPAFCRICGYSAEELKTLDYWELTPRDYEVEEGRQLDSLERTGHYGPYEKEYVRKDGSRVPLRLNGMLIRGPDGQRCIWSIVEDISDRKAADLAMARERTRLETILRTASDGIHILDASGLLVDANDAFLRMLGRDRQAIGQLRVQDWDAGLAGPQIEDALRRLNSTREPLVFETRHRRSDGSEFDVEISARSIVIDGRSSIYASSRDITLRKATEGVRANLAAIVDNSNDAIISRDRRNIITSWNRAAERLFGYSANEAIGRDIGMIVPPDRLDEVRRSRNMHGRNYLIANHETVRVHKSGRRLDVAVTASPIYDDRGELASVALIFRDTGERKRELALMQLLESLSRAANEATTPEVALRACLEKICGHGDWPLGHVATFAPGGPAGGAPQSYWHTRSPGAFIDLIAAEPQYTDYAGEGRFAATAVRERRPLWCDDFGHPSLAGGHRISQLLKCGLHSGFVFPVFVGREIAGVLEFFALEKRAPDTMLLDVVGSVAGQLARVIERSRAAAELARLNAELETRVARRTAELEAANKELDSFSYTIAHDMRAPVRAINGFSELVLKATADKLDARTADYLKRVIRGSHHMSDLIDDLLNLARLSRQEMKREDFDLGRVAAAAVAALREAEPARTVEVTIAPGMMVYGDAGLARALLDNLIGNAWKFTSKTERPSIAVGREQRDGRTVYTVRDNGAGFDMQYAHKLFAPFQRLHHSHEFEGTGIGLATVKRIVQRHEGAVGIESTPGVGTCVWFTLGGGAN